MQFWAERKETVILDPRDNMNRKVIPSEIRKDPLTSRTARICHFMALKWQPPDFHRLVEGTEKSCPFCPEHVMQVTPCFPEDIVPEGRMVSEDMVLFPNIAPYDGLSAVATMGSRHFISMTEFGIDHIAAAFRLAMRFFRKIDDMGHPESVYHLVNWNYMPAAGSSLIHPHLQIFVTSAAPNLMREELEASKAFRDATGLNFWDTLVEDERNANKRYLGKIGRTHWLSAYAPMGVAGDVLAVMDGVHSTLALTDDDLHDIADGLVRTMAAYDKMGIYTFNMNFFTGSSADDHTRFHLLFSPRTFFNQALGTPDVGALRNLYNESLCMAYPEEINEMLKPYF
jgi:galactose-1-phosphate uridylyltransferase